VTAASADEVVVCLEMGPYSGRIGAAGGGSTEIFSLPVGTSGVVALFRHDPPTEGELERAIELIEDAVMPLATRLPRGSVLVAGNDLVLKLAKLSTGCAASHAASLAAVEVQFEQIVLGARRGAWSRELQIDPSLCAGLLILREFMHHAGFDCIELRDSVASMAGENEE
jgi:hypothetical protein